MLGGVADIVGETKLRHEKGFLFKRHRVYMITEKPLRYNTQNTADVVRVIRRPSHNTYDVRRTHCTMNAISQLLPQKNMRIWTERQKEYISLTKGRKQD